LDASVDPCREAINIFLIVGHRACFDLR
jgi:hypothetical protein